MNNNLGDMSEMVAQQSATNLHPLAAVFMLGMACLVLFSRPSRVLLAVILVCVFMPPAQRLVIGALDFPMPRLIVGLTWLRVLVRREYIGVRLWKLDRLTIYLAVSVAILSVFRAGFELRGVLYQVAAIFETLGLYLLARILMRRREQVAQLCRDLAWTTVVFGAFMSYEFITQHNAFSVFGSDTAMSEVRDGTIRCQGPFAHPILAGTFGGMLFPVFIGIFGGFRKARKLSIVAMCSATIVVIASGSAGPLIAWVVGVLGWGMWRVRYYVRFLPWLGMGVLFCLHLVMNAPVWALIGKLGAVTGGTGYHRYHLIDAFINHFDEWALLGTDETGHWGWGLQDTTNEYVAVGTRGGLLSLVLFVLLLRCGFRVLRLARERYERAYGSGSSWSLLCWGFSVSLTVSCVSFVSVSYFGGLMQIFLVLLATIPALSSFKRGAFEAKARQPRPRASTHVQHTIPLESRYFSSELR